MGVLNFRALRLFITFTVTFTFTFTSSYQLYQSGSFDASKTPNYALFSEVEKTCKPFLSSASKLEFNADRVSSFMPELSFVKGHWGQTPGDASFMPFDGSDAPTNSSDFPYLLYLPSFTLIHVDMLPHSRIAINISGALGLGISRNGTSPESGHYLFPEFRIWPWSSELRILFEGVYVESKRNGGERVLCLLRNDVLPSHKDSSVSLAR